MKYYIEMLAYSLVDKFFIERMTSRSIKSPNDKMANNYIKYDNASLTIENLLCTTRESLLGSGAWNQEFKEIIQSK